MRSGSDGMDRLAGDTAPPLDVLCAEIVERYHASLHRTLPLISAGLGALCDATPSLALREVRHAFSDLADQIAAHLAKEEHLLFPAFAALAAADREHRSRPPLPFVTVLHPIRMMEAEHARIDAGLERLRDLSLEVAEPDSVLPGWRRCLGALTTLARDLREHHRRENELLFPLALEIERRLSV